MNNKKIYIESAILAGIIASVAVFKLVSNRKKRKTEDLSDLYEQ